MEATTLLTCIITAARWSGSKARLRQAEPGPGTGGRTVTPAGWPDQPGRKPARPPRRRTVDRRLLLVRTGRTPQGQNLARTTLRVRRRHGVRSRRRARPPDHDPTTLPARARWAQEAGQPGRRHGLALTAESAHPRPGRPRARVRLTPPRRQRWPPSILRRDAVAVLAGRSAAGHRSPQKAARTCTEFSRSRRPPPSMP